jgi:hypothetical protein
MTTKTTTKPTEPMPSRTDLLQQELAQHQAEADRRRAALLQIERDRLEAQRARERAFDEQVVADGVHGEELDAAVEQARRNLQAVIAADPLTVALTAYMEAQSMRRHVFTEYVSAAARLGQDMSNAQLPPGPGQPDVLDLILRSAEDQAHQRLAEAQADFHARRTGTDA